MKIIRAGGNRTTALRPTRVVLIRHAETDAVGRCLAGRTIDVGINDRGRGQADELAALLPALGIDVLYTSPRRRARETAAPVAATCTLDPIVDDLLDEIDFGDWTGASFEDLAQRDEWRSYNGRRGDAMIPGGEAPASTLARVAAALATIHRRHQGSTVAAVTHAEIVRYAVLLARGLSLDQWMSVEVPPAGIAMLRCDATGVIELPSVVCTIN